MRAPVAAPAPFFPVALKSFTNRRYAFSAWAPTSRSRRCWAGVGEDPDRVPVADPAGVSGGQLEEANFLPDQGGAGEGVVLLAGEQMPAQHGELAGHGHGGDVGTSPGPDPLAERPEGPGGPHGRPRRLDQ